MLWKCAKSYSFELLGRNNKRDLTKREEKNRANKKKGEEVLVT
jgi:hypothetical protein